MSETFTRLGNDGIPRTRTPIGRGDHENPRQTLFFAHLVPFAHIEEGKEGI